MSADGSKLNGLKTQWAAFIAPFVPGRGPSQGWRPISLRPPYLASLVCLMFTIFLTLEGLRRYSDRMGGLAFYDDTDDVSALATFLYNDVPIIAALILYMIWTVTDFDILRLEPYFQLSQPGGAPAIILFINYNFGQTVLTPINAARRRHWIVVWVSLITLSLRMLLPALQATLFELREVNQLSHEDLRTWPDLVSLDTQANWMSAQINAKLDSVFARTVQSTRSSNYAIVPVEFPDSDIRSNDQTLWSMNSTIFWAEVSCESINHDEVLVNVNSSTGGYPTVSWNTSGVDIGDTYGNGNATNCRLDFSYESVFLPGSDYLQVRYWEPAATHATEIEYPNRSHAFSSSGCDQHDIYGMLIGVNATSSNSSSDTKYIASGTALACEINYYKADALVNMHSNSSIFSIEIHPTTKRSLTSNDFNIDYFEAILFEQAPYTSDMIFLQTNSSTGTLTETELPAVSEQSGDFSSLLVSEISSLMTAAQFEKTINLEVKQTFSMTVGRLFDHTSVNVTAIRSKSQVAISIVTFAALWSEAILLLAVFTTIYLLFLYRTRETFLRSDPGSIGAMSSIAADVFHPSNILARPQVEFHQFSTGQLRRIFKKAWCRWVSDPTGNRLEIIAEDGSPVQLGEDLRVHADPMPHFLLVPFFLIEFLALAGVTILMCLIISSLARDGKFSHLDQSSSSALQAILSILPAIVASTVGSLCTSIHRNLSVLEPWVHLQRGMASARTSLSLNYASQSPFAVFLKSVRDRHVLLVFVSFACVLNMALTVVSGGLFTQKLVTSSLPTNDLTMNYSQSVLSHSNFAAAFTEYDLIQTSITSGVPILPWSSPSHAFVPLHLNNPDSSATYRSTTLGIGSNLECRSLSPSQDYVHNKTSNAHHWRYFLFNDPSTECRASMSVLKNEDAGISLSMHFLAPDGNQTDACRTSSVLMVARWNYLYADPVTSNNTVALQCQPQVLLQNYSLTFDMRGQVLTHHHVPNTLITEGELYNNATVSLGQFNKVFSAIPERYVGNTTSNGSYSISSYDWAGFLVARLYEREDPDFDSLEPVRLIKLSQKVYQWVYGTYFSLWRDVYLEPLAKPIPAVDAIVIKSSWFLVSSVPLLIIGLVIIVFDTFVVLVVFGTRRGRFKGPRLPRSIGSIIPWIVHSRMLRDFEGTHSWTNTQRSDHLSTLNKRYGFRMFMSPDNRWRFAVEEELAESKPLEESVQDTDAAKTIAIELNELPGPHSCNQN
ncbi:hypothetical protein N7495_001440 [Penicillium taxi]|uniref:uncharacterized protein n=1 Tax=Penicillium taxi TaxID=168475 RepID=UPI0025451574|nr:uncharacterized protein N7495_001440 [Penicillium taxi]KAJ5908758.1 hypothetical protein N7495_001440 [Penicillium taxi]